MALPFYHLLYADIFFFSSTFVTTALKKISASRGHDCFLKVADGKIAEG